MHRLFSNSAGVGAAPLRGALDASKVFSGLVTKSVDDDAWRYLPELALSGALSSIEIAGADLIIILTGTLKE